MAQKPFGGQHTKEKLEVVGEYLRVYQTALKSQSFQTLYIDAFAGSGQIPAGNTAPLLAGIEEAQPFIEGSAALALQIKPAFDRYVFVERAKSKAQKLREISEASAVPMSAITIINDDANASIVSLCRETDWRNQRGIVFLDPFGNNVRWSTIVAIAETKAIDLWYLFPAGLGVHRQISNSGSVEPEHADSLDRLFGTHEWRDNSSQVHHKRVCLATIGYLRSKQVSTR